MSSSHPSSSYCQQALDQLHHNTRRSCVYLCALIVAVCLVGQQQLDFLMVDLGGLKSATDTVAAVQATAIESTAVTAETTTTTAPPPPTAATAAIPSLPLHAVRSPPYSIPPEPIEWFDNRTRTPMTAVNARHSCIQRIRQRHDDLLNAHIHHQANNNDNNNAAPLVVLVDPSYHGNVGDHLITLAELTFLTRQHIHYVYQCGRTQTSNVVPDCGDDFTLPSISQPSSSSVAVWQGGGNWGDLWRNIQQYRIPSFAKLLKTHAKIVGMPQSLFYQDASVRDRDATTLRDSLHAVNATNDQVVLSWRELDSFQQAQQLYPFCTNLLVPDIAFQLGPFAPLPSGPDKQVDILLFLRVDKESALAQDRNDEAIQSMLSNITGGGDQELTFKIVDWNDRLEIFNSQDHLFTETSIQLLSLGRVVVCDRLHASILSYLSGQPFVYIDQMTGKISKALSVALEGCDDEATSMFAHASNLPQALALAVEFLSTYDI